jgi:aspartate carbamoyltransferase regulatory subunit
MVFYHGAYLDAEVFEHILTPTNQACRSRYARLEFEKSFVVELYRYKHLICVFCVDAEGRA